MNLADAPFDPATQLGAPPGDGETAYVYDDAQVVLAINVALATGRPLLVTGPPGSGKSSLAADVARRLGWAYIATVVTSRTRLSDLVAEVDLVRRLNDAQAKVLEDYAYYLVPGVLWWAFDPDSARQAPLAGTERLIRPECHGRGVVALLDEIDKAEPDLPNDLLGPLGGAGIDVPFHGISKPGVPVLLIVTSNGERDMPPAFVRRCLFLDLDDPQKPFLVRVAEAHYGPRKDDLYGEVASRMLQLHEQASAAGRRAPSTAEFLDTVAACVRFDERPSSAAWQAIEQAALRKTKPPRRTRA